MTCWRDFNAFLLWCVCALFAFSLQTQITLFSSPTYLGLRINLTDLLIPFVGIGIMVSLFTKQSAWPRWPVSHFYLLLGILSAIVTFALFNTWLNFGEISRWGLINKFTGWFVLLAILGAGGWVGTNASEKQVFFFLKTLTGFFLVIFMVQIASIFLTFPMDGQAFSAAHFLIKYPLEGLMVNRNAYGLLFVAVIAILTCFHFFRQPLWHDFIVRAAYFFVPFFVLFNGSRMVLTALCVTLAAMAIQYRRERKKLAILCLFLLTGYAITFLYYNTNSEALTFLDNNNLKAVTFVSKEIIPEKMDEKEILVGDIMRLQIVSDSWELVKQNPIFGSGLGSAMVHQQRKHGELINLIDSTPFWLLVETGLIGLCAFAFFYFQTVRTLIGRLSSDNEFIRTTRVATLYAILGFSIMCLFHEIMYTRHMWFLIGLALCLPARTRQDV